MAHHGIVAALGHRGCLVAMMVGGSLVLAGLIVLMALGIVPVPLAAVGFAVIGIAGLVLLVNVLLVLRAIPGVPAYAHLLNETATVLSDLTPAGRVQVHGENWAATLDAPFAALVIPAGRRVRVVGMHNLQLIVTPPVDELIAQVPERLPPVAFPNSSDSSSK